MPSFSHHPSALVVPEEPLIAPGYPERFRVRLAGRVEQVWLPALQDKPMYRAELVVAKSKPLQWSSPLALIGMPIVEPPGEDFEEESEDPEKQHHLNTASLATVTSQLEIVDVAFPSYPPFNYGDRVILKWQGQQMVPGVLAGALLRCSGVVSIRANQPIIYNPRYEIVPQFFVEKG
ncbi:asparaginase [Rothia mucilaginosa]|jgi:hypothetical protein|uniref:asparaginase n=1 Tax=Rothia mucilaginosa TaxID=43675 RepID=UPI00066B3702|nr:asparaginase [Rothia mucilaginosa]